MKFSLFVHMERLDAGQSHQSLYDEYIELCEMADRGGMSAIWTGEHHGMDFTIAPNPFINLADLARRTTNVRLGTGTVIAPFWHPIKLAGEAAMTDIITGGRLDIGIARGAYNFEYQRLSPGLDAVAAGQRMRELVPAIKGLWAGDYAHEGETWSFPTTTSAPKPLQAAAPADLDRRARPQQPRLRRRQWLQRAGHAARARRRGDRELDAALQRRLREPSRDPAAQDHGACATRTSAPTRRTSSRRHARSASTTTTSAPGSRTRSPSRRA